MKQSSADLLETLQDSFHVFISPEKVSKRALDRVEVSDGLIPLCGQLSDRLAAGQALLLLLVLCRMHQKRQKTRSEKAIDSIDSIIQ